MKSLFEAIRLTLVDFPSIAAAYLYGSALRPGEVGDVDLALVERPEARPLDLGDFGRLERTIHERTSRSLPPLDLRRLTPEGFVFAHGVIEHGQLVYEADSDARVAFEVTVQRLFLDAAWLTSFYRRVRAAHGG